MHSMNAAIVESPAWRLVWALSTLKNQNEEITIEGFNEAVVPPNSKRHRGHPDYAL